MQQRDYIGAQAKLEEFLKLKASCKVQITNNANTLISAEMRNYVNNLDSCVTLQVVQSSLPSPAPRNMSDINTMSQMSISDVSLAPAKSIDSFNKEVYDKLIKSGNTREDAKYAATGVSTMKEAMEKLKKKK